MSPMSTITLLEHQKRLYGRQTGDDLMVALANLRQVKRGLTDDLLTGRVRVVWTTNGAKGTKRAKE